MSTKTEQIQDRTSEKVTFSCVGCGRDTVVHVGNEAYLEEKRCVRCMGSDRVRSVVSVPAGTGRKISGTHGGRVKDPELRERRKAKAQRARSRKMGQPFRASCASYGCDGHQHRKRSQLPPRGGLGKGGRR